MSAIDIAVGLIKEHEGFSATPYLCPAGYPTIGYGRNLDYHPLSLEEKEATKDGVSKELAEAWLRADIEKLATRLSKRLFWKNLNEVRRAVIIDLVYNVGVADFNRFKDTIAALRASDFETASDEMVDSKWYRQTGRRAKKLVNLMRSGVLDEKR